MWPLWRALLNDVARPWRLQHFEDIIDGSVPLDVWDSQGNYKHKCLIIHLLFSLQQQQHKCNTQGYTETREIGKEESKFVFISTLNQAIRGTVISSYFSSFAYPYPAYRCSPGLNGKYRLPPNWTWKTWSNKSGHNDFQTFELVTWHRRLNPANHSTILLPSLPATMHPLTLEVRSSYHLVNSAGPVVTLSRTGGVYVVDTGTKLAFK